MLQFDLPQEQASIIKVVGIGGGGSNAVNHMYEQGIRGVNFVVSNTDGQAMELSPVPNKIQLGPSLTSGLGAGSNPEVGRKATEESIDELRSILEKNTRMVFVTAGMGGGTGTGGAPVVAKLAKDMGILTVGIVTTPFFFEGKRKMKQAENGIEELRNSVDSIIVISNDKIREIYGNLTRAEAFAQADNILAIAARSISEIITVAGQINVDFADVEYVMKNSGIAIMGSGVAEGEDRAAKAVQAALSSPLLNDNDIRGARKILLNITSGANQMLIDEITEIHEFVLEAAGNDTDVIFGTCDDESLGDKIAVTLIATGFEKNKNDRKENSGSGKLIHNLSEKSVQPKQTVEPKETEKTLFDPGTTVDFDFPSNEPPVEKEMEMPEIKEDEILSVEDLKLISEKKEMMTNNDKKPERVQPQITNKKQEETQPQQQDDEMKYLTNERLRRLRSLNMKMNTSQSLNELENEPAFKRRNIQLTNAPHSSENNLSRYTLSSKEDEEDEKPGIRKNNSFLHDNVD